MKTKDRKKPESQDKIISEFILDRTFVPGVTVTASADPFVRRKLNEQIAFSISRGEDFLGVFETQQDPVFMMPDSEAEYNRLRKSLTNNGISESYLKIVIRLSVFGQYLSIEPDGNNIKSCSYNPSGIIGYLTAHLDLHEECKVIHYNE